MAESGAVEWPKLMQVGLGMLRLSPDAFWSMTPREFRAAVQGAFGDAPDMSPMTRAALDALEAQFPDAS